MPYFLAHGVTQQELDEIFRVGTVDHYDKLVWCKRHHLTSVYDYYDMVSLVKRIPRLSVPSMFFNVADDQIAGKYLPLAEFKSNSLVSFVLVNRGNHLGTVTQDHSDLTSRVSLVFADAK